MQDLALSWVALAGVLGMVVGVVARTVWERRAGGRTATEAVDLRIRQLERQLTEFYWPLYARLMRDSVVREKVIQNLGDPGAGEAPKWTRRMDENFKRKLSREIQSDIILPNHLEAAKIVRSGIHLTGADRDFVRLLESYIRYVDTFSTLRASGIWDADPVHLGEPCPPELFDAVSTRLRLCQDEYDALMREHGAGEEPADPPLDVARFRAAVLDRLSKLRPTATFTK